MNSFKAFILLITITISTDAFTQNKNNIPIKSITIEGKILFNDSLVDKKLKIMNCDSNGKILNKYSGFYLIKYKKFSFVYCEFNLLKDSNESQVCKSKFKMTYLESRKRVIGSLLIRTSKNYITLDVENNCYSGYTALLRKNRIAIVNPNR